MAKRNSKIADQLAHANPDPADHAALATVVDSKPPRKQYIMRVVESASFKLGTARHAWYCRLVEYNGQTLEAFTASCTANPPSTPAKGKLTGMLEPVGGWVSFFKGGKKGAEKLLTLVEA
jgi:hypothetical protein